MKYYGLNAADFLKQRADIIPLAVKGGYALSQEEWDGFDIEKQARLLAACWKVMLS